VLAAPGGGDRSFRRNAAAPWRSWRANRAPLLFGSALRFAGLTMSKVLLVVDKLVLLDRGLGPERLAITLAPCLPPLLAGPPEGRHAQASQCG
jgi:hypothetical protein